MTTTTATTKGDVRSNKNGNIPQNNAANAWRADTPGVGMVFK